MAVHIESLEAVIFPPLPLSRELIPHYEPTAKDSHSAIDWNPTARTGPLPPIFNMRTATCRRNKHIRDEHRKPQASSRRNRAERLPPALRPRDEPDPGQHPSCVVATLRLRPAGLQPASRRSGQPANSLSRRLLSG